MTEQTPYFADLRSRLVEAAERKNRNRKVAHRVFGAIVVIACVAIAGTMIPTFSSEPAAASVKIENEPNNMLRITLTKTKQKATEAELRNAFAARGIQATIMAKPVAPPMVGRFVYAFVSDTAGFVAPEGTESVGFDSFRVQQDVVLDVGIGRAAKETETYSSAYDATLPGGKLACAAIVGAPVQHVQDQIVTRAQHVRWITHSADGSPDANPAQPPLDYKVERVVETDTNSMSVFLTPPAAPVLLPQVDRSCE